MQLTLAILSLSLSALPSTIASSTCSSSSALSWPPVGDCSASYSTIVQNCRACCMNDADCFQACAKAAGLSERDTLHKPFFSTTRENRDLTSRAATLNCDTNEGCYMFTDGSLLCLNLGTGLYHDDVEGHGDYYTGEYTGPDGKVQTGTSTATATGGKEASSIKSQTSRSTAQIQATLTESTGITFASSTSAASPAISTGGSDTLYHGANIGLVGLVAGLVL